MELSEMTDLLPALRSTPNAGATMVPAHVLLAWLAGVGETQYERDESEYRAREAEFGE